MDEYESTEETGHPTRRERWAVHVGCEYYDAVARSFEPGAVTYSSTGDRRVTYRAPWLRRMYSIIQRLPSEA